MSGSGIPIIRLEIEGMKTAILTAFMENQLKLDSMLKDAVEKFCSPENVERIMNDAVNTTLKKAIESEIDTFFRYGKGNVVLKEAVTNKLSEMYQVP